MKKNIHNKINATTLDRVKLINWFLEFAQLDIEKISIYEKIKWVNEYHEHVRFRPLDGEAFSESLGFYKGTEPPEVLGQLDRILEKIVPPWFQATKWIVDHTNETWFLLYQIFHQTMWRSAKLRGYFTTDYEGGFKLGENLRLKVYAVKEGEEEVSHEMLFPMGFQFFIELLSGYPTTNLRGCFHCQRFLFIYTRKLRNYCTPFCQKAAGMKRLRNRKKKEAEELHK